jgi:hypothetical protein
VGVVRLVLWIDPTRSAGSESAEFATGVSFEVWALLLSVTVAVWVAIAVFLWRAVVETFTMDLRAARWPFVGYLVLALAVLGPLFAFGFGPDNPLYGAELKVRSVVTTIFLLGFPAVLGLWRIQERVSRLQHELPLAPPVAPLDLSKPSVAQSPEASGSTEPRIPAVGSIAGQSRARWVAELLGLRRLTQRILIAVSIGISAGVLSAGSLRTALLDVDGVTAADFPSHWVLLYGTLFTVVFALVFVPSFLEWRGVASRLVDESFPIPHDGRPTGAWHEGRQHMSRMLGLDASPLKALGPLVGIMSPLLLSVAAAFIPELSPN